jgi:L-aspartate oxidase
METVVFGKRVVEHLACGEGGAARSSTEVIRFDPGVGAAPDRPALQRLMWEAAGIERDGQVLSKAFSAAASWSEPQGVSGREQFELRAMSLLAQLTLDAALRRTESRGAHYRRDFPERDDLRWKRELVYQRG